ncbi:hypothetical protein [Cognatishimia activa]|uniref:Uncharacterized protein n=1 Tax=Cognatishimia activa TaxID=1715691 RepID=A0A0P1IUB7_9RHOB|nr:hypothetical protein [Cognatishimia activa]MEE2943921.1 hypothetical protein [Pseudomonadota bacterium]CUJ34753.1 hypothetical protein TA5113_03121 [Cognatishimia activa]CUK27060.1 hypothetical protein TA5114_02881 [Cognatishimia activa]
MLYPIAELENEKLSALQALEKEIGGPVVALTQLDTNAADLSKENLQKIKEAEEELGVVLVALRPN